MTSVELRNLSKDFGKVEAVRDVSLSVHDREFLVLVGPSGCGKSTALRLIAGLEEITRGDVSIGGKIMNTVPAADRGVAMVFQSYALYPHMSVRENIGFGLKMAGVPVAEVRESVASAAATLQIDDLLDRRPRELSGGQKQRVAIGRAIVKKPDVFLFDEPLSNLDADLRAKMRVEIARLHRDLRSTVVYVTHDQVEAMTLADRIAVMHKGKIEQVGSPDELYERPANIFVAGFLGQPKMNFLDAELAAVDPESRVDLGQGVVVAGPKLEAPPPAGTSVVLGLRPDALQIGGNADGSSFSGTVELVEHLGNETLVHVRVPQSSELVTVSQPKKAAIDVNTAVDLTFEPAEGHLFATNGLRLT